MEMRTCTKCGEEKALTAEYFYRNRSKALGYSVWCKICDGKPSKKYREENLEKIRAYKKKWCEDNPTYQKKYREANREKVLAGQKKWREENREKAHAGQKKWREANREYLKVQGKKWRNENSEKTNAYMRSRRRNDPTFRLQGNLQTALWSCLSGKQKKSRTLEYVAIDLEKLWEYFESKFTDGMTRENYGEWHVDHIRPLSSFDFDQFKEGSEEYENLLHQAWHYTNLQPLWAKDNLSKNSKWEGNYET
jgi:hypothetical protein